MHMHIYMRTYTHVNTVLIAFYYCTYTDPKMCLQDRDQCLYSNSILAGRNKQTGFCITQFSYSHLLSHFE